MDVWYLDGVRLLRVGSEAHGEGSPVDRARADGDGSEVDEASTFPSYDDGSVFSGQVVCLPASRSAPEPVLGHRLTGSIVDLPPHGDSLGAAVDAMPCACPERDLCLTVSGLPDSLSSQTSVVASPSFSPDVPVLCDSVTPVVASPSFSPDVPVLCDSVTPVVASPSSSHDVPVPSDSVTPVVASDSLTSVPDSMPFDSSFELVSSGVVPLQPSEVLPSFSDPMTSPSDTGLHCLESTERDHACGSGDFVCSSMDAAASEPPGILKLASAYALTSTYRLDRPFNRRRSRKTLRWSDDLTVTRYFKGSAQRLEEEEEEEEEVEFPDPVGAGDEATIEHPEVLFIDEDDDDCPETDSESMRYEGTILIDTDDREVKEVTGVGFNVYVSIRTVIADNGVILRYAGPINPDGTFDMEGPFFDLVYAPPGLTLSDSSQCSGDGNRPLSQVTASPFFGTSSDPPSEMGLETSCEAPARAVMQRHVTPEDLSSHDLAQPLVSGEDLATSEEVVDLPPDKDCCRSEALVEEPAADEEDEESVAVVTDGQWKDVTFEPRPDKEEDCAEILDHVQVPASRRLFCGCIPLPRWLSSRHRNKSSQGPDAHVQEGVEQSCVVSVSAPRVQEGFRERFRRGFSRMRRSRHPEQAKG